LIDNKIAGQLPEKNLPLSVALSFLCSIRSYPLLNHINNLLEDPNTGGGYIPAVGTAGADGAPSANIPFPWVTLP
jgi:hypothetical protein